MQSFNRGCIAITFHLIKHVKGGATPCFHMKRLTKFEQVNLMNFGTIRSNKRNNIEQRTIFRQVFILRHLF